MFFRKFTMMRTLPVIGFLLITACSQNDRDQAGNSRNGTEDFHFENPDAKDATPNQEPDGEKQKTVATEKLPETGNSNGTAGFSFDKGKLLEKRVNGSHERAKDGDTAEASEEENTP